MNKIALKDRLILALDVDTEAEALRLVEELSDLIGYFKIGMQLYYSTGNHLIERIHDLGGKVFLDLKLHDIPNTVYNGARVIGEKKVQMLNFHASGGKEMLKAAARGINDAGCGGIGIAVTILTSLNDDDLEQIGYAQNVEQSVRQLALLTKEAGLKGVVCSPQEIAVVKEACGENFLTITPGIRLADSRSDDQKRITTPYDAMLAGGDYLVIGRPIRDAKNPRQVTENILKDMEAGLEEFNKRRK